MHYTHLSNFTASIAIYFVGRGEKPSYMETAKHHTQQYKHRTLTVKCANLGPDRKVALMLTA